MLVLADQLLIRLLGSGFFGAPHNITSDQSHVHTTLSDRKEVIQITLLPCYGALTIFTPYLRHDRPQQRTGYQHFIARSQPLYLVGSQAPPASAIS